MGIVSEVKCGRCDRRYSGLRGRCPYCGARRNKSGKRASSSDNSKWHLIVGVLILVVLVAAVIVLIVTSHTKAPDEKDLEDGAASSSQGTSDADSYQQGEGVTSVDGNNTGDNAGGTVTDPNGASGTTGNDAAGTTTPTDPTQPGGTTGSDATAAVQSVVMSAFGAELPKSEEEAYDYDITMSVSEKLDLSYATTPTISDPDVKWSSSDESVVAVLSTGSVTALTAGEADITLTIGGVSVVCHVRVG